jgi:hypothetical protein
VSSWRILLTSKEVDIFTDCNSAQVVDSIGCNRRKAVICTDSNSAFVVDFAGDNNGYQDESLYDS